MHVRRGWDALCATLQAADRALPAFVTREVEQALCCGDPAGGFAWLACPDGHHHRLVPFSCQTRAFCPSCGGRRMAERALRWTDELLPRVAVRQLVLTVPWPRRLLLARRPELARGVLNCALDGLYVAQADGTPRFRRARRSPRRTPSGVAVRVGGSALGRPTAQGPAGAEAGWAHVQAS
ncbi:MAG: hypothetical protein ACJAZO_002411 [Myxococcota bacterium]|jgi:hypothetical protein